MDEVAGGGGGSLDFLSTHPSSSNRVVKVREWAEEVCFHLSYFVRGRGTDRTGTRAETGIEGKTGSMWEREEGDWRVPE